MTPTTEYEYDTLGRQSVVKYPEPAAGGNRLKVKYNYTSLGFLHTVTDQDDGKLYWGVAAMNASGQVTDEYTRNGVETVSVRNPSTGWLLGSTVTAHANNDAVIQDWTFRFDEIGNLGSRTRSGAGVASESLERFEYDNLDRLTLSRVQTSSGTLDEKAFNYDQLGNLIQKGDNTYTYGGYGGGPHAVSRVNGGAPYVYDANGNMLNGGGRAVTWNPTNKPTQIGNGSNTVAFAYGADGHRVQQTVLSGSTKVAQTVYVGLGGTGKSLYERTTRYTGVEEDVEQVEHVHFIYAGGAHGGNAFALRVVTQDATQNTTFTTKYNHFDHLGSVTAMSDEQGRVVATGPDATVFGYDPWGARRSPDGQAAGAASFNLQPGHREFTSHETIPTVGLVNMNGRIYDPDLGRFLSPDSNVQFIADLQSYNRYSYVHNNPLRYSDPTGYGFWGDMFSTENLLKTAIMAGVCVGGGPACTVFGIWLATLNATAMYEGGASVGQVVAVTAVGMGAGYLGGLVGDPISAGLAKAGENVAGAIVGGAISGAISSGITSAVFGGGSLGENMLKGAASGAFQGAVSWGFKASAVSVAELMAQQGDTPGLPPNCNKACQEVINKAFSGNPHASGLTGTVYYELTGEVGGDEYDGKVKGLPKATIRSWAVDRVQRVLDELHIKYDVSKTVLYIGGDTNAIGFGAIRLTTPGSDTGKSFLRTGRSLLHEIGHQAQAVLAGGWENMMAIWRSQMDALGGVGPMYETRGSLEYGADQFANSYLPRLVR